MRDCPRALLGEVAGFVPVVERGLVGFRYVPCRGQARLNTGFGEALQAVIALLNVGSNQGKSGPGPNRGQRLKLRHPPRDDPAVWGTVGCQLGEVTRIHTGQIDSEDQDPVVFGLFQYRSNPGDWSNIGIRIRNRANTGDHEGRTGGIGAMGEEDIRRAPGSDGFYLLQHQWFSVEREQGFVLSHSPALPPGEHGGADEGRIHEGRLESKRTRAWTHTETSSTPAFTLHPHG